MRYKRVAVSNRAEVVRRKTLFFDVYPARRISNNPTLGTPTSLQRPAMSRGLSHHCRVIRVAAAAESIPIARTTRTEHYNNNIIYYTFRAHRSRQPQTRFSAKCRSVGRRAACVRACGCDEGQSKDVAALPGPSSSEADAQKHFYPTTTTTPQPPNRRSGPLDLERDLLHCAYY